MGAESELRNHVHTLLLFYPALVRVHQRTGGRQEWQEAVPRPEEGAGEAHQGERGAQGEVKGPHLGSTGHRREVRNSWLLLIRVVSLMILIANLSRNRDSKRLSLPTTAPTEGESPGVGAGQC